MLITKKPKVKEKLLTVLENKDYGMRAEIWKYSKWFQVRYFTDGKRLPYFTQCEHKYDAWEIACAFSGREI